MKNPESCVVTSLGTSKENGTRLLLRDQKCADRVYLGMKDFSTPKLEVRDQQEKLILDVLATAH